jgi:hypothetical protein
MEHAFALKERTVIEGFIPFDLEREYEESQGRKSVREGEFRLMLAVLEDAVKCYLKYAPAKDRRGKQHFREAEEWIFQRGSDWLFSFENVCEVLGIDPDYMRDGLARWKKRLEEGGHSSPGGGSSDKAA